MSKISKFWNYQCYTTSRLNLHFLQAMSPACALHASSSAAAPGLETLLRVGWKEVCELFQVGTWPWFGANDAMDDLMPWGRGSLKQRHTPQGGGKEPDMSEEPSTPQRDLPFYHLPVLMQEVLDFLQPAPGKLIFDGTLGGGGHTEA